MYIKINEQGFITVRIYDESGCKDTTGYIKVDGNTLSPDIDYTYINSKFKAVNLLDNPEYYTKNTNKFGMLSPLQYLQATDYVVIKYQELVVLTKQLTHDEYITQYTDILNKRVMARDEINKG